MQIQYPKRLIEVDLPIKRISAHARREKSIRHGHISTLHIWWARRPLAACRAVICASLWPDPADELCPQEFRDNAIKIITDFAKEVMISKSLAEKCSKESLARWNFLSRPENRLGSNNATHLIILRFALLDFIADFANWDNASVHEYLETSRLLTQIAHTALGGEPESRPLVVDPFAGGGAIPLEALRIGADAFASDLNPVAVLLNKVVLEYIPQYKHKLAKETSKWGAWLKTQAEKELSSLYPKDPEGTTPIAYLWARTIKCEGPNCGAEIPLIRSLWLAKKGSKSVVLKLLPNSEHKTIEFEIETNKSISGDKHGTVRRGNAICPICGYTTSADKVRVQFMDRKGGNFDARLFAVVVKGKETGRYYRIPTELDITTFKKAVDKLEEFSSSQTYDIIPQESLPYLRSIFNINLLGVTKWKDLFSPRQLLTIATLVKFVREVHLKASESLEPGLADAVTTLLAIAVNRQADYSSSLCSWHLTGEKLNHTFGRQALGIIWDFAEVSPFVDTSGNFKGALNWVIKVCNAISDSKIPIGQVAQVSATNHPLPDNSIQAYITDPPYYDAVPYADLSDFFYVWFKRSLGGIYPNLLNAELTPKRDEIVQLAERNPIYSYKTKQNFESLMTNALSEGRRVTQNKGIGIVVFAHKTTSAWETLLQAVIDAGWTITSSWPIDTEMSSRLRAMDSAALNSSVHLVCRPRDNQDSSLGLEHIGDWRNILTELPKRIHEWMPRLAEEGVVGADAIFACLGPALEIFSRFSSVEKASGEKVSLKEYLEEVWAAVSREALNMIFSDADVSGFEEDARLTAMWLWTLRTAVNGDNEGSEDATSSKSLPGYSLEYDAARKIAQGLGAHLEHLTHLVETKGDTAMLLSAAARTKYLFSNEIEAIPKGKRKKQTNQLKMDFVEKLEQLEEQSNGWRGEFTGKPGSTTLDQVHQSMILFAAGRGEALKRFLVEDGVGRNPLFWRLGQALSALYPGASDEKRWVDGVLARKKGLEF